METIQALLTLGRNSVPSLREQNAHAAGVDLFRESNDWAIGTLAALLGKARLEATGQTVRLQSSSPIDEAKAAAVVLSYATTARTTSARAQSANNLKQIGLAFYNYAEANKHFPPPVCMVARAARFRIAGGLRFCPILSRRSFTRRTTSTNHGTARATASCSTRCRLPMPIPALVGASKSHTRVFRLHRQARPYWAVGTSRH